MQEWQEFFKNNRDMDVRLISVGGITDTVDMETLYQMFKARMLEELAHSHFTE